MQISDKPQYGWNFRSSGLREKIKRYYSNDDTDVQQRFSAKRKYYWKPYKISGLLQYGLFTGL